MKLPYFTRQELIDVLRQRHLFSDNVKRALVQAEKSHARQNRDDGQPYLEEHIYPVTAEIVNASGKDTTEEIIMAALLHDTIEDDPDFNEETCRKEFSNTVAEFILPLTKSKEDNRKDLPEDKKREINLIHSEKILRSRPETILIKLSDGYNNLSCMGQVKDRQPERFQRYIDETEGWFLPTAKKYSDYFYQKLKNKLAELK